MRAEDHMKRLLLTVVLFSLLNVYCTSNPHVVIITNMGEIEIELFASETPKHAENFITLVNEGYFVGTLFHRVVPGTIIQGGDPNSKDSNPDNDGTGGPGYNIDAEIKQLHKRGSVAAARLPDRINPKKQSSGSQFYICVKDLPGLDKAGYTVFGQVVRGMEIVDKIARLKTDARQRPQRRVVMERVYEQ